MSCIFMDDLEHLMGYSPVGQRYQSLVLDALYTYLAKAPPKVKNNIIIIFFF